MGKETTWSPTLRSLDLAGQLTIRVLKDLAANFSDNISAAMKNFEYRETKKLLNIKDKVNKETFLKEICGMLYY